MDIDSEYKKVYGPETMAAEYGRVGRLELWLTYQLILMTLQTEVGDFDFKALETG